MIRDAWRKAAACAESDLPFPEPEASSNQGRAELAAMLDLCATCPLHAFAACDRAAHIDGQPHGVWAGVRYRYGTPMTVDRDGLEEPVTGRGSAVRRATIGTPVARTCAVDGCGETFEQVPGRGRPRVRCTAHQRVHAVAVARRNRVEQRELERAALAEYRRAHGLAPLP